MTPTRRRGDERGAELIELAIILPILILLVVGIIDFGLVYGDAISVRQGVRDGARETSVANFGSPTCQGLSTSTSSVQARQLMCVTRDRINLDTSKMRVAVCLPSIAAPNTCSTGDPADYVAGNAIILCAMYPASSRTGLTSVFLDGKVVTTRVKMRIEQTADERTGVVDDLTTAAEVPLDGHDWGFCVP